MNELEKAGFSPQVQKALEQAGSYAAAVGVPADLRSLGNMLSAYELEGRMDREMHRAQRNNRQGHPAIRGTRR